MGLDNYPREYPCKKQGTAVLVMPAWAADEEKAAAYKAEFGEIELVIDCKATQRDGGCPYMKDAPPQTGAVYGMLGTDCWYRGKYGAYLLDQYLGVESDVLWGGTEESGYWITPDECVELAEEIDHRLGQVSDIQLAAKLKADNNTELTPQSLRDHLSYLSWYLKWAAGTSNGLTAWF